MSFDCVYFPRYERQWRQPLSSLQLEGGQVNGLYMTAGPLYGNEVAYQPATVSPLLHPSVYPRQIHGSTWLVQQQLNVKLSVRRKLVLWQCGWSAARCAQAMVIPVQSDDGIFPLSLAELVWVQALVEIAGCVVHGTEAGAVMVTKTSAQQTTCLASAPVLAQLDPAHVGSVAAVLWKFVICKEPIDRGSIRVDVL
jgi:hypothetical protein